MTENTANFKTKLEGTEILSYISETGKVVVDIKTDNAVVLVNNAAVSGTFGKDAFNLIPNFLRKFIGENQEAVSFEDKAKDSTFAVVKAEEVKYPARFTFLEDHTPEKYKAQLEWVVDNDEIYELLSERLGGVMLEEVNSEIKEVQEQVKEFIESNGFGWEQSSKMAFPFFAWWNITFTAETWNEEKFIDCWKVADKGTQVIEDILNNFFVE